MKVASVVIIALLGCAGLYYAASSFSIHGTESESGFSNGMRTG